MCSGGDDGSLRVWDIRKPDKPVFKNYTHDHWIWGVEFNRFHDSLLLSCGSDYNIVLSSIFNSIQTPVLAFDELESDDDGDILRNFQNDGIVNVYNSHKDSVYSACWSLFDPWIFTGLSYDGRFSINFVPKDQKDKILL